MSNLQTHAAVEVATGATEDLHVERRQLAGHHPPGDGHHPPGHGTHKAHHPPGHGHHPPSKGHHPPHGKTQSGGHHPPGHGHHPPKSAITPAPAPSSVSATRRGLHDDGELTSAKAAMNALEKDGRFKAFHRLLQTFKLSEAAFRSGTVFAPTDAAFEVANEDIIGLINSVPVAKQAAVLSAVLLHHMQEERLTTQGVKEMLAKMVAPVKLASKLNGQHVIASLKPDGKVAMEVFGAKAHALIDNDEVFLSDDISIIAVDHVLLMPTLRAYAL